jgi:rubrerythrin
MAPGFEYDGRGRLNSWARSRHRDPLLSVWEVLVFEIREILDLAIRLEKNGEATYRKAIQAPIDEELKAALEWMAQEEARHGQWFAKLQRSLDTDGKNPFMEKMSRELFDDLVGGQSFSLKEVDFATVESIEELVGIFMEFEKDTVLFYEMVAPFIEDGETRTHLETIIAEENRHIARLKDFNPKSMNAAIPAR